MAKIASTAKQAGEKIQVLDQKLKEFGIDVRDYEEYGIKTDSIGGFMSSMTKFTSDKMFDVLNGATGGILGFAEKPLKDLQKFLNPMYWTAQILGERQKEETLKILVELLPNQVDPMMLYIMSRGADADFNKYLSEYDGWIRANKEHEDIIKTYRGIQGDMFKNLKQSLEEKRYFGLTRSDCVDFENWCWRKFLFKTKVTWQSGGWRDILNDMYIYRLWDYIYPRNAPTTTIQMVNYYVPAIKKGLEPITGYLVYDKSKSCTQVDDILVLSDFFRGEFFFLIHGKCVKCTKYLKDNYAISNEEDYINFLAVNATGNGAFTNTTGSDTNFILKLLAIGAGAYLGTRI